MSEADHPEHHASHRLGWLRASVLGANDGLLSTASILVGIAAASQPASVILLTGLSALVAGALSMAAGEYVSVASQADTEAADLKLEAEALIENPDGELSELTAIYQDRGLKKDLAHQVAVALTAHDALEAHARDELGFTEPLRARPVQAALASALSFVAGGIIPVITAIITPAESASITISIASLAGLIVLGYLSAKAGGASPIRSVFRLLLLGSAAMLTTGLIGSAFGGMHIG